MIRGLRLGILRNTISPRGRYQSLSSTIARYQDAKNSKDDDQLTQIGRSLGQPKENEHSPVVADSNTTSESYIEPLSSSDNANLEQSSTPLDSSIPWYLRQEVTSTLLEKKEVKIPSVPSNSPPHVSEFLDLLAKDLGIDELLVFDIASLSEEHEFKLNHPELKCIIIGTGKSEKHIYKAASELRTHIKHTYGVVPSVQGMVSSAKTPAARRRLLRKARRGPSATDNDYGFSANSWILCIHDGVEVHMLTEQRRVELNLELIWCAPEDAHLYEIEGSVDYDSDNVLYGFNHRRGTRGFHTSTRQYSTATQTDLNEILVQLKLIPLTAEDTEVLSLKNEFMQTFETEANKDFDTKTEFLRIIHLARPNLLTFQEVEESLLLKYAQSSLAVDLSKEKARDVTEYAKLLVDSPEITIDSKEASDMVLDKLSRFISSIYEFSSDTFTMDKSFWALLWRLTYTDGSKSITPNLVSAVIEGQVPFAPLNGEQASKLAYKNSRNVLFLASYHDKKYGTNLSADQKEFIVYTYGNCGKWEQFWSEWNTTSFLLTCSPAQKLDWIVRLVVFLALTGNKSQAFKFLSEYWRTSSSVCGSFLDVYQENLRKFNSEQQKVAFVTAITSMIDLFEKEGESYFEEIKEILHVIESDNSTTKAPQ